MHTTSQNALFHSCAGVTFSSDPKNIANIHSYKYSGLAQPKAIGITSVKKDKKTSIVLRATNKTVNKPKSASTATTVSDNRKKGFETVNAAVNATYFRPDLRKAALARYSRLLATAGGVGAAFKPETGRATRRRTNY